MKRQLELGDVFKTDLNGFWFVDQVGGHELVRIVCVRPPKELAHATSPGYVTTTHRQPDSHRELLGYATDFDHASAIVALNH